jgi:hypothetical protein
MSQNITIRLTPEEKAELERLNAARWEASLASRRAFCAVASYERWVLERAFAELPVPPGYASEYLLMMQTLTPDGTVEGYTCGKVYRPTKGCSNEHLMLTSDTIGASTLQAGSRTIASHSFFGLHRRQSESQRGKQPPPRA